MGNENLFTTGRSEFDKGDGPYGRLGFRDRPGSGWTWRRDFEDTGGSGKRLESFVDGHGLGEGVGVRFKRLGVVSTNPTIINEIKRVFLLFLLSESDLSRSTLSLGPNG